MTRVAALAVLLTCGACAQSPNSNTARGEAKKDKGPANPGKAAPVVVPAPITQIGPVTITNWPKKEVQQEWQPWWNAFVSNWPLILIGVAGTIVGLRTLGIIKRQTEATQIAANAAKESADTAARAAEVAEKTLLLTERADVLIESIHITTGRQLNVASEICFAFRNFGRTRATEASIEIGFEVVGGPAMPAPSKSPPTVIGPSDKTISAATPLATFMTQDTINAICGRNMTLKYWATVTYMDVFGKAHSTRCGGSYDPSGGNFDIGHSEAD